MIRYLLLPCLVVLLGTSLAFAEKTPTAVEAWEMIAAGALIVDVRTPDEFASGHLDGAQNIPYDKIADRAAELGSDKERPIVVYCRTGRRAGRAQESLAALGFKQLYNAGGYQDLVDSRTAESH